MKIAVESQAFDACTRFISLSISPTTMMTCLIGVLGEFAQAGASMAVASAAVARRRDVRNVLLSILALFYDSELEFGSAPRLFSSSASNESRGQARDRKLVYLGLRAPATVTL